MKMPIKPLESKCSLTNPLIMIGAIAALSVGLFSIIKANQSDKKEI